MRKKLLCAFLLKGILVISIISGCGIPTANFSDDSHLYHAYMRRLDDLINSSEWGRKSVAERNIAAALTAEEMAEMSTKTLLRATLANPTISNLFFFNTFRQGFERVFEINPGLRELSKREDFVDAFISVYTAISDNREGFPRRWPEMEIIMAQPEMHQQINEEQAATLVELFIQRRLNETETHAFSYLFFEVIGEVDYESVFYNPVTDFLHN